MLGPLNKQLKLPRDPELIFFSLSCSLSIFFWQVDFSLSFRDSWSSVCEICFLGSSSSLYMPVIPTGMKLCVQHQCLILSSEELFLGHCFFLWNLYIAHGIAPYNGDAQHLFLTFIFFACFCSFLNEILQTFWNRIINNLMNILVVIP